MRIISGKYRGHQLVSFQASHLRPTTDRVKESLFNILMGVSDEARVLDLFSGTGNLGLEALSRGAKEVVFVDDHPKSLQILQQNLKKLKVTEPVKIFKQDALRFIKSFSDLAFDLILIDPPFTKKMAHSVMSELSQSKAIKLGSWVSLEAVQGETLEKQYDSLKLVHERDYGDKRLCIFESQQIGESS